MEVDFASIESIERYRFLTSVVVPRPIAWVTTLDAEGRVNAAPFSFFNVFGSKPAMVALGIGNRSDGSPKHTALNIGKEKEFVINMATDELAERMVQTSFEYAEGEDELKAVGLSANPSVSVKPPRIAESPVHLECREIATQEIGGNRLIIGEVLRSRGRRVRGSHNETHSNRADGTRGTYAWPVGICPHKRSIRYRATKESLICRRRLY